MENKKLYFGSIGIIVLILGILATKNNSKEIVLNNNSTEVIILNTEDNKIITTSETNDEIVVYISGEVNSPDVYTLPNGSRVVDLVELAGGVTDNANVNDINLSKKIKDEDHIHIPAVGETTSTTSSNNGYPININTATKEQLKTLPNIGDVTADNIIKYREENNGFKNIEEIKNVSRIGDTMFQNLKDYIIVNGG